MASVSAHSELLFNVRYGPVLILFVVAVPVTLLLNATEFLISGRLLRTELLPLRCLEITILGSAANMLPLPGSTLVRVAGLKAAGASYVDSTAVTLLIAVNWIGIAFLCAGIGVWRLESLKLASVLLAIGGVALAVGIVLCWRISQDARLVIYVMGTKVALVIVDICRVLLCFEALGVATTIWHASAFSISGVLGSAVSIVPAGLGVREGVSAIIAPLVGLSASAAFLAAALNRLVGLVVIVPVALVLTRTSKSQRPTQARPG
ncbi:MAG: lysylphosphatidylglycerol synthase domain-containing protein [Gammaproteobacteria bacterium]|nr:lysylphosphatidylglycerol synthase domain-containing protein [Gammaproteobacteria bacterium]